MAVALDLISVGLQKRHQQLLVVPQEMTEVLLMASPHPSSDPKM